MRRRRCDLDDSARLLSARQAFLIDGDIAEARICAYPYGNDAVHIGSKGSRECAIDIELHPLHGTPARAEGSEGGSCVLVDDLVGYT